MKYILAIDQSTSGTKAMKVDARGRVAAMAARPHRQYYPAPGYVEHDAEEIYQNVLGLIEEIGLEDVEAIALANQRETTVFWDRESGRPLCPAVVWQDVRAESLCRSLRAEAEGVLAATGLKLSPYYPAAKAAHVLKHRAFDRPLCVGTIDSYLLFRLTGGRVFATDLTNASRTQLMNLQALDWDGAMIGLFGLKREMLADRILPSDACFGHFRGVPITGVLGDSHASLFGHGCRAPGMVKTSYGTGSSLMMNVGEKPILSRNGLSASVAYASHGRVEYVLEGNITCSADTLIWLRDGLGLIDDLRQAEEIAASVPDAQGVCLVPAFAGLGAPYFDSDARAVLCGMNRGTTRAHVVRAALESIAQQNADVLEAMGRDAGRPIWQLSADGGGSVNRLLMQMQADLARLSVSVAAEKELTALGAARIAGLAVGLYEDVEALEQRMLPAAHYEPRMPEPERARMRENWADAVRRARGNWPE